VRLKLPLLAAIALAGAAGLVQAQQTPAPASQLSTPAPETPEAEEAPPAPSAPPASQPAPTAAEKPVTSTTKPKAATVEKPAEPTRRTRSGAAIIQAIDKVTAETLRFEAPIGQPIRYKTLVFTVRACETSAPDEATPDSVAYMTIDSQPKSLTGRAPPPPKQVFRGWMFSSSPGLNPLQHPVYDAWLIACRASGPDSAKR
jgi:hypothetical protein